MRKIFIAFVLVLTVPCLVVAADVYVKSLSHSDPVSMMGQNQPARDNFTEQWIGDGQIAVISPSNTMLIDLNKNVMRIVNDKAKTYVETTLPLDYSKMLPAQMGSMLQGMKTKVTVKATGNKKTYGTRSCDEYEVSVNIVMMSMTMTMKVYASMDVPLDYPEYVQKVHPILMKSQFIGIDDASVAEFGKIQGYWIAQETNGEVMGAKIHQTTEVIEITSKPAPAGTYELPAGYTKQDTLSMQDLQGVGQ